MVPLFNYSKKSPSPHGEPTRRTPSSERFAALSRHTPSTVRPVTTFRHGQAKADAVEAAESAQSQTGFKMPPQSTPRKAGVSPVNSHPGSSLHPKKQGSIKKKATLAVAALAVMAVALVGADLALSQDIVHWGVKVEGVDVGGLNKADATAKLQTALDAQLAGASVQAKPDASAEERLAAKAVSGENDAPVAGQGEGTGADADGPSVLWTFSAADLGASVDAAALVDEAYETGKAHNALDFIPSLAARFNSWTGKVDLPATLEFDETKLEEALKPINDTIGIAMVNSDLDIDKEGFVSVRSGQVGIKVDQGLFESHAQSVLLSEATQKTTQATATAATTASQAVSTFSVPMRNIPLGVNDQDAQEVADQLNIALADPITLAYGDHTWTVDAPLLGRWITTSVKDEGTAPRLVATIDEAKAYEGLQELMGEAGYGSAQNAQIDVSSGTPVIVGGAKGDGPDLKSAAADLQGILFDNASSRRVTCETAPVDPAVTAADIASLGIVELIASYELGYGSGSGSDREYNIERCLDLLNNSQIAPGQAWNWNEVVGLCDESTGFRPAGAINDKNEVIQEPGGGICNVATGVFNAAYEAGLPILERANHSIYMPNYPLGRDAAVSWEYPTLAFENDTDHYILVTASYDGSKMVISIWGTSPHRTVESKNSDWVETTNGGKSITNYRTVKTAEGEVWLLDTFYSYFPPQKDESPEAGTAEEGTAEAA